MRKETGKLLEGSIINETPRASQKREQNKGRNFHRAGKEKGKDLKTKQITQGESEIISIPLFNRITPGICVDNLG